MWDAYRCELEYYVNAQWRPLGNIQVLKCNWLTSYMFQVVINQCFQVIHSVYIKAQAFFFSKFESTNVLILSDSNSKNLRVMGTFIHLVCIAAAALAILAHPAVAQGTNTTLPLTYPGRVLQGDGSQTCPSEEQREIVRNEVKNATRSLLHDSVVLAIVPN